MKSELLGIISEIIELLTACQWKAKAEWFQEKARKIQNLGSCSAEMKEELGQLRKIIAGMGSFDDLPLHPTEDSGLSKEEARVKQTELGTKLGEAIEKILAKKE